MKQVSAAFVSAQRAFGPALKSHTNPHFRSKYADLSACVEAVLDALNANGLALMQKTHQSDSGVIVETTFIHESGESLSAGTLHFPASKNDAQGFMSALTYCRRGALMAACGIAPEDDDGNAASKPAPKRPANYDKKAHIPATAGIENTLSADQRGICQEWADEATDLCRNVGATDAIEFLHSKGMEDDERLYVQNLLPLDVKSAMKKVSQQPKAA